MTNVNGSGASVTPVTGSPAFRAEARQAGSGVVRCSGMRSSRCDSADSIGDAAVARPTGAGTGASGWFGPGFCLGRTFWCLQLSSCGLRFEMQDYLLLMPTGVVHPSLLSQVVLHFAQKLGREGRGRSAQRCGRVSAILRIRLGMPQLLGRRARRPVLTSE